LQALFERILRATSGTIAPEFLDVEHVIWRGLAEYSDTREGSYNPIFCHRTVLGRVAFWPVFGDNHYSVNNQGNTLRINSGLSRIHEEQVWLNLITKAKNSFLLPLKKRQRGNLQGTGSE